MNSILAALRELPSMVRPGFQRESYAFSKVAGGFPRGSLVEVSGSHGSGKTEVILEFLAQNPQARVAWVEENFTVYPVVFPQSKVELERVLFVDAAPDSGEALWTAHQILKSGIFGILVLVAHGCDEMALRRLQLAAEKSNTTIILINEKTTRLGTWPISIQMEVRRSFETSEPEIQILKQKNQYGLTGTWTAGTEEQHAV